MTPRILTLPQILAIAACILPVFIALVVVAPCPKGF